MKKEHLETWSETIDGTVYTYDDCRVWKITSTNFYYWDNHLGTVEYIYEPDDTGDDDPLNDCYKETFIPVEYLQ